MAEIGLAVAQTLFAALSSSELKQICAIWGYESQIEDLNKTVTTIKNVLMDAESKVLTKEAQGYVDELKNALHEADDLFDEFVTLLELNQLQKSPSKLAEFKHKFRRFFSSDKNQVSHAYRMFHGVKKIQKKLNAIVDNHKKFSLGVDYEPICMRREDTCSYVDVKDIIGRDHDKTTIIDKLLESKDQHVQFLTIVGVGGLGKTALAQLVYNDERLKHEFGDDFMFWVCVSDQDKVQFEVKAILCKILESTYKDTQYVAPNTMEKAQKLFREKIREKKFLLVLDDLWNEDREKWIGLETLLKLGQGGSRVLITTRSDLTATSVGSEWTHVLQGLSLDHSWKLFEMTAFNKGINQQSMNHTEMVEIGKKIIEKCNNIPLAIKVVGSLLFGQSISTWRSFEKSGIAKIDNGYNKIMSVLKLSYYNLRSSLKNCFTYCAVFPKDFVINKRLLIHLWMAQGYIEPLNGDQSVEDAAEEHFKILLRRCFFQDVKKDKYDEIESVKIHDLMHDIAQQVGGEEFQVLSSGAAKTFRDITRHVTITDEKGFKSSSNWSNLRTLLTLAIARNYDIEIFKDTKVGKWKSLRALELKHLKNGMSLNSIGELQHLRYLDLSYGGFEELPNSITKLHNLQTLILYECSYLRHLPYDFSKLVKLSHLNLDMWADLTGMPLGLDKLIGLRVLTDFVVGRKKNIIEKQSDDELKALGALTNLTGRLFIGFGGYYKNVELMKDMEGGYLSNIPGLKQVVIKFNISRDAEIKTQEAALEKLEPHPNIKILNLDRYGGRTIPWWRRANDNLSTITLLSNLVHIRIEDCFNLVSLPSFSKLPLLRSLKLFDLKNLEYMETRSNLLAGEASDATFFPSLQTLNIERCSKWKGGWFREEGSGNAHYGSRSGGILSFPCLSSLCIINCRELTSFSFPPCQSLQTFKIYFCSKLEGLPEWISCLSFLQSLTIYGCNAIESLPEGIQNLTSLQTLEIEDCPQLKERCREPDGEDWPKIQHIPNKRLFIWDYSDSDSE